MKRKLEYLKKEAKYKFKEFKFGTKKMFKEFLNKETNKKQRANMWTFLRLIIPIPIIFTSAGAMMLASNTLYSVTAGLVGFGALTDYFDGASARKHDSTSEYGKLLDQIADKVFAGVVGINLLLINPIYLVSILGELLIAGVNVGYKLKHSNLDIPSSKIGKIKQWPLFISLGLGFLSPINSVLLTVANSSIALSALFQILTANSYVVNNKKEVEKLKENEINEVLLTNNDEEEKNKEKELVLTKENKSTTEKLEELRKFRDTLTETQEIKTNQMDNIEKTKTLN